MKRPNRKHKKSSWVKQAEAKYRYYKRIGRDPYGEINDFLYMGTLYHKMVINKKCGLIDKVKF